ncbi:MAG TPA: acylneuraminate cytidylyltransferase family protein [Candidatus Nanoarchaeia archaeon]|nr:acylneuraminate cytidylyltransferase family protein [Candidatus Nanoarchaeia archaeon]
MYKNKRIIAVIPARGGSKTLPRKNILPIDEKPLIYYSIKHALESEYLDKTIVSTEDAEIKSISEQFGAGVLIRPPELATDKAPTIGVLYHVLDHFEKKKEFFDILVLLEPTSPLRKKGDIDRAIELFVKNYNKADALVSLGEIALEKPHIAKIIKGGFVVPFVKVKEKITHRQQLEKTFFPYGVIYLSKTSALKKTGTFYQKRTIPYLIERWQNYEVDDLYDFIAIEAILKHERDKL